MLVADIEKKSPTTRANYSNHLCNNLDIVEGDLDTLLQKVGEREVDLELLDEASGEDHGQTELLLVQGRGKGRLRFQRRRSEYIHAYIHTGKHTSARISMYQSIYVSLIPSIPLYSTQEMQRVAGRAQQCIDCEPQWEREKDSSPAGRRGAVRHS
jgi:hypothetical protein